MVLRRCRRLLGSEDEALDACQDVFVRVMEHRERLTNDHCSSLLYRLATNVCLNRIRDRARRPTTPDDARRRASGVDRVTSGRFVIDGRYTRGVKGVATEEEDRATNRALPVTLGWRFR